GTRVLLVGLAAGPGGEEALLEVLAQLFGEVVRRQVLAAVGEGVEVGAHRVVSPAAEVDRGCKTQSRRSMGAPEVFSDLMSVLRRLAVRLMLLRPFAERAEANRASCCHRVTRFSYGASISSIRRVY